MNVKGACLLGTACAAVLGGTAAAGEIKTYSYDALGRLIAVKHGAGVSNGRADSLCYDAAGNRSQYVSSAAGTLAHCPAGPPPPPGPGGTPPPSGNQPPVANADVLTAPKCVDRTVNVTQNDTDPEGNVPLTVTAVNQPWAWVASGSSVGMTTPDTNGIYTIAYTVSDTLGASSTGTLTVTVSGTQQCV
jgi:YD repeat-containing protein